MLEIVLFVGTPFIIYCKLLCFEFSFIFVVYGVPKIVSWKLNFFGVADLHGLMYDITVFECSEQPKKIWTHTEWDFSWSALSNWKLQSVSYYFFLNNFIMDGSQKCHDHAFLCVYICSYGYLTNTKVKFILVTTDLDVRDADVRNVSFAHYCIWSMSMYSFVEKAKFQL